MDLGTPNPELDADLKKRVIDYILREICRRYRESDLPFSFDEIERFFKISYDPKYLNLNIRDLLKGSGLLDINDDLLILNDHGQKYCEDIQCME